MNKTPITLCVVMPLYQDAKRIMHFLYRLEYVLGNLTPDYEIICCLNPSSDKTEQIVEQVIEREPRVKLLVLSRHFGTHAAILAGMEHCRGKTCVVIEPARNDPPELIAEMYAKMQEGFEVVYGKRRLNHPVTRLRGLFYKIVNKFSDVPIDPEIDNFRLMTSRVIDALTQCQEKRGFLRGLVAYVGFKQTVIEYNHDAADDEIPPQGLGWSGLISFSSRPLQIMSVAGAFFATVSFLLGVWYVIQKLMGFALTPGLSTTILIVTFFSGVQLLSLGLMGEYVGRIYDEVKRRPMFIVDKMIQKKDGETSRSHKNISETTG